MKERDIERVKTYHQLLFFNLEIDKTANGNIKYILHTPCNDKDEKANTFMKDETKDTAVNDLNLLAPNF
ncbi:hypothetical protein CRI85_06085 [Leuconostoc pseudomesenteroides]|nr:hypothetical protein [Leuconostoc pseudomesenteroides]